MEILWRLIAVLSGVWFAAGTAIPTLRETPARDSTPHFEASWEASNSASGEFVSRYPAIPAAAKCPEMWALALRVGWAWSNLQKLDQLMWRESRCTASSFNDKDPNGGSLGLMQINFFWCKPNRYTQRGFLQDRQALTKCSNLADPAVNLTAALAIFENSGWSPWET